MTFLHLFFGFRGRLGRASFWLAALGSAVATAAVSFVAVEASLAASQPEDAVAAAAAGWPMIPLYLVSLWITLALTIKRCHDRNYPAVMAFVLFVPVVGAAWALIDLGCIPGTPGDNAYGPSPARSRRR
ncbi:MAG TPA: DUF805 domain-containing protein [Caulobacteraceae bacterium]|jgi:uncharacterized membrane protein YhaH (DUF805 family)|nr:DUF805 domain-containing protein [Caulobacteraceae bacterium]